MRQLATFIVVMVMKGEFFVFALIFVVVFVVRIMQPDKIKDTDIFLMKKAMLDEVMKKFGGFKDDFYALTSR